MFAPHRSTCNPARLSGGIHQTRQRAIPPALVITTSLRVAPIRSSSHGIHSSTYTSWYPYPVPIGSTGSTEMKLKISDQITLRSTGGITWRVTLGEHAAGPDRRDERSGAQGCSAGSF